MLNLQEEVFGIPESISSSLDDFDLIVHPLENTGIEWIFSRREDSPKVRFEFSGKVEQRLELRFLA